MERYDHGGDVYSQKVELDFSVNVNPLGMPPQVREALIAHVDDYVSYPDAKCRALRAAIARAEGCPDSQVLCGNGAADLILRLCLARKPRRVLICAPTFSEYEKAALLSGAQIERHLLKETDGFALGEDFLDKLRPGLDMVFLCNPNNPTGRLIDGEILRCIVETCQRRQIRLVIDQCFLAFTGEGSVKKLVGEVDSLVVVDAFTKLYAMAGLRLGYMLCSDGKLLGEVARFGQSWSVSSPAQIAGLAALDCGPGWIAKTRETVGRERAYLSEAMAALGMKLFPSAANYLFFKGPLGLDASLLRQGLLIRSCANYTGLDGHFYRIGVKMRPQNERLIEALEKILQQLPLRESL